MAQKPNPWQKLVRGILKEAIDEVNQNKVKKRTRKKPKATKKSKKRNRYISTSVRVDVLTRDNYRCVFCGATSRQTQLQIDHIIPVSQGGSNDSSNLQTLCWECNRGKSDRLI